MKSQVPSLRSQVSGPKFQAPSLRSHGSGILNFRPPTGYSELGTWDLGPEVWNSGPRTWD